MKKKLTPAVILFMTGLFVIQISQSHAAAIVGVITAIVGLCMIVDAIYQD